MITKDDKGYILITCLLLLLVLTVIGLSAIGTSTVENILSGNMRLRETNLSKSDAGTTVSVSIIERAIGEYNLRGYSNIVPDANLPIELRAESFSPDNSLDSPDVVLAVDSCDAAAPPPVRVDIDKMYVKWIGGSAMEFASGYEGMGKSAGSSGFYTFYRINSTGPGIVSSEACVGCIYKYVPGPEAEN